MKIIFALILFLVINSLLINYCKATNIDNLNLDKIVNVLINLESSGNDFIIGDNGKSVGCLQIQECVIKDVNMILKEERYSLEDRKNRQKSIDICRIYLLYYCSYKRLKRVATIEDYAKCWNGGPNYFHKSKEVTRKLEIYYKRFLDEYNGT